MYASFLRIARALQLDVFEQPEETCFFNNLLVVHRPPVCAAGAAIAVLSRLDWFY